MDTLIIKIEPALNEDGGYMIDLYLSEEDLEECESVDGGQCTSEDMATALEMAHDMAQTYIKNQPNN